MMGDQEFRVVLRGEHLVTMDLDPREREYLEERGIDYEAAMAGRAVTQTVCNLAEGDGPTCATFHDEVAVVDGVKYAIAVGPSQPPARAGQGRAVSARVRK